MRMPFALLLVILFALSGGLLRATPAGAEESAEEVLPHEDDVVKAATERFEKDYAEKDMDKRLRILKWYGMHMHKDVLKRVSKIYLKESNLELQAAAAEALGNQRHDPKKAARYLMQGLESYEKYASREDPEEEEEMLQEQEATVLSRTLIALGTLGVKPDKNGWKVLKGLIDHNHDEVAIAMLNWCGATQEWRALPVILEWFNFYPDGYSWAGGSTSVDTGAAGTKDAKAAKAKWHAKYGARARKARPKAHAAMRAALKAITGLDFEKPEELKAWMKENKQLLKQKGV